MCGIVGALVFGNGAFRITEGYITSIRDTLVHRGPDGGQNWISADGRIGLGHRRLSIIDLSSAANQPMCNEDGTLFLVFNGEIYNHAEIRRELAQSGKYRWKTDHSDTEVILHAFEEWGIECIARFRGMFAIALWDAHSRCLWLIRDRIGIKPLYYSLHHSRLVFASEIKALLKDPDQSRSVDLTGVYHYLSFLTTPAPGTMFEGIRKLPPGTWLRIHEDGNVEERRYWDVWDHTKPLTGVPEQEIVGRLLDELRTSVALRKVSDVPVGVFLSGGLDSSTNAALFSEGHGEPIQAFTVGYEGEYKSYRNEIDYARIMANSVHADHHELRLSQEDLISFLPQMVKLQDEPLGDSTCVPTYYVSKLAREKGVIVCHVGEGADELFLGYPTWRLKRRLQLLNDRVPIGTPLKRLILQILRATGQGKGNPFEALQRAVRGLPVFWGGVDAFTDAEKRSILSPHVLKQLGGLTSWEPLRPIYERFRQKAWEPSILHWMSYVDLNLRLPELLLMRVDKMTMGASIEARVPFLDHKFVEFALSIPEAVKFKGTDLKPLLKKAVRGLIPDELIHRKKQGFAVPLYEWFLDRLGQEARQTMEEFCRETGIVDRAQVSLLEHKRNAKQRWYLLNLALWWKCYFR
jgi:asparagine synthase (glutamine-hydrolysing)